MEKWMVVAGVWSMCALCAVLFIRGAAATTSRRVRAAQPESGEAAHAGQR
jgi:ABC-type thiamin/hydroxymethylpyrimidine transport system permease subunit